MSWWLHLYYYFLAIFFTVFVIQNRYECWNEQARLGKIVWQEEFGYLRKPEWRFRERNEVNDGNAWNQGGNAGNQGGNVGNQGGNARNQSGNVGNEGGNVGNQCENAGNQGGNAGNQCDSLWESSCLLLRLISRSARGAFHHPALMDSCPTSSHRFFALSTWGKSKISSSCICV